MINKIKSTSGARFKKTNFNSFLFFLILAVIIWVFVQFSKDYTENIKIPVEYVNVPPDKVITDKNPDFLELQMQNTGFKLAYFSLFPPKLSIDISKTTQQEGELLYNIEEHRNDIRSQLDIELQNSHFLKDVLKIQFQQRKEKTIPVVSRIEVGYAVGYAAVDNMKLNPDSVTVSGPDNILDTLNQIFTKKLKLKDVNQDLYGKIAIDSSKLEKITIYTKKIEYELDIEKFTEGRVELPVELISVPKDLNVVIFPKKILLFYQVNLKDFSDINATDFRVVCDFEELDENQDFMIPKVVKKPKMVTNVRLNEKKIQFIIKK